MSQYYEVHIIRCAKLAFATRGSQEVGFAQPLVEKYAAHITVWVKFSMFQVSLKNGGDHSNVVSKATGTEYASVDVQDIGGNGGIVVGACAIANGMKQRDR